MYAQSDNQRLLPKPKAMLPGRPGQSAKQPMVKAPPSKILYPSEQAASAGSIGRAHAYNAAHPNTTFFTPHQEAVANRMAMRNNPLGTLGSHAENFLNLKGTAQELASSFDPRTKGGIANIASLFAGGPEGHFDGEASMGFEKAMPGQFEKYSMAKAAAGGHMSSLSSDRTLQSVAHDAWMARNHPNADIRMAALQRLHDTLFGGEVHAKGEIPQRPNDQTMAKLNENRAKVREQIRQERLDAFNRRAQDRAQQPSYDAAAKHHEAMSNFLRNNSIHPRMDNGSDLLWDHLGRGPQHPDFAGEHPARFNMGATRDGLQNPRDVIAQRQAALERFYRQQAHNHRN